MVTYNARHRIYVTEQDDKKSVAGNSRHCAVAVAIGRQLEWSSHVDVNSQRIRILDPENREVMEWITPDQALVAAIRKDENMPFKEISFVLDESLAKITPMKAYTPRNSKGGKRTGAPERTVTAKRKNKNTSHRTMGTRSDLYQKAMYG